MLFGITNDHSNYMQRPKRGSTRKWENRSLKVELSLTMGWLPLRLRNTIGGGIPGMEPMLFGITNDHSNYMQRPKRGSTRKWENRSLKVDLSLNMGWLPLRLRNTIGGRIPGMEPMLFRITNDHSNYLQRPKRGSTRKWENRSLKVDLSSTMGWLPLRLRNTIGGGIPGMEPMLFGITNDHSLITWKGPRGARRGNGRTRASKSTYL